ncbi:MAG: hypothetical protein HUU35_10550, partial [Armatimonadetes bacterium]|nr:hypothetical protein [Armatimonadota bacterium]
MRWTWLGGRGLPYFKRAGARVETYTWLEDWDAHCYARETIAELRAAGFNLVTIPYFTGFGLRTEARWLAAAPELVEACHDQGMRALATVDLGGICVETIAGEVPEFEEWLHRDPEGRVVWASPDQYWRGRPDLTHPGYRDYIGQVIEQALRAGFDGIWFDDVEPRHGYQPTAVAAWREFIAGYTDFYARKCGYLTHAHLAPPPREVPGDPLWLDWEDFWQQRFVEALADYNDRVKRLDPERLTVLSGPFQEQHPWEKYRLHLDAVHLCNPWMPGVEHGEVVSHASLFLISDAAEVLAFGDGVHRPRTSFADLPVSEQVELSLAEGMFFGGQSAGASWATLPEGNAAAAPLEAAFGRVEPWHCAFERSDRFERIQRFLQFCERTAVLHRSDDSAATIAVLHSRDSLRFEREGTILNLRAAQMACLRRHLPADALVSDDLARLDRYDVLIIPEQACLSQAALERISSWVRGGGGLILVGEAA